MFGRRGGNEWNGGGGNIDGEGGKNGTTQPLESRKVLGRIHVQEEKKAGGVGGKKSKHMACLER